MAISARRFLPAAEALRCTLPVAPPKPDAIPQAKDKRALQLLCRRVRACYTGRKQCLLHSGVDGTDVRHAAHSATPTHAPISSAQCIQVWTRRLIGRSS